MSSRHARAKREVGPGTRPSRVRALVAFVALVAGAALSVCAFLAVRTARHAVDACHPPRRAIRPEERASAASFEPALLHTADGLTLVGWYVRARNRAAVILVHGGGDNRAHWLPEIRALAAGGYGVLAYDARGSGESGGDLVTGGDRERLDVAAALDFAVAQPDVDPGRVGLVGFSIGSSAVALVAARDPRVHAVVLEAIWPSFADETRDKYGKWGPLSFFAALWGFRHAGVRVDEIDPIDHVAEIQPRPLLFIAGGKDADTPPAVVDRVFAAAAEPKKRWVVPAAHHGDYASVQDASYPRDLVGFFDRALAR